MRSVSIMRRYLCRIRMPATVRDGGRGKILLAGRVARGGDVWGAEVPEDRRHERKHRADGQFVGEPHARDGLKIRADALGCSDTVSGRAMRSVLRGPRPSSGMCYSSRWWASCYHILPDAGRGR